MEIEGKIALVIGGASGIGLSCVKELLRCGIKHVTICDCNDVTGENVLTDVQKEFGEEKISFIKADVTKAAELEDVFKQVISNFQILDIVLNMAGCFNDLDWEREIEINMNGMVRGTLLALQYMGKDKGGQGGILCNTASIAGLRTVAGVPVYAATKHGIVGLSRSFGEPFHFNRTGVRIVAMCPGLTETPMLVESHLRLMDIDWTPQLTEDFNSSPMQKPENVAEGMMTLIREASSGSVWVSEASKPVYELDFPHYELLKKK